MEKSVLILGARGRLGGAVAQAFADSGWRVLAHRRAGGVEPRVAHASIQWLQTDLADTPALATAAGGASAVVHAMNPAAYTATAWRADMPRLTQQAIDAALALDARLLFAGNVYNYGAQMPAVLTPDTPQAPTTEKGRIRVALEQQLRSAASDHGLRATVIRAGDFFGSGSGSWLDLMIVKKLPQGRITWPGPRDVPHAWAFLPDLARDFVRVAQAGNASGSPSKPGVETLMHAGLTVTGQQWVQVLTDIAREQAWLPRSGKLRINTVPWGLMALAAPFSPMMASLREMRYLWTTPHGLDGSAMAARVGAPAATSLAQAAEVALMDLGMLSSPRADVARAGAPVPATGSAVSVAA